MCHISNSPPAASVTCGHCTLINKLKGYLTKEDADISSDLFFAEVVKGKVMTDLCGHSYIQAHRAYGCLRLIRPHYYYYYYYIWEWPNQE